jgi:hypothetical protein
MQIVGYNTDWSDVSSALGNSAVNSRSRDRLAGLALAAPLLYMPAP